MNLYSGGLEGKRIIRLIRFLEFFFQPFPLFYILSLFQLQPFPMVLTRIKLNLWEVDQVEI